MKRSIAVGASLAVALLLGSAAPAPSLAPSLTKVHLTKTSAWSTASPDPTGLTYVERVDSLYISDSEIDESNRLWKGSNLFEAARRGALKHARTLVPNKEPEDVAWDAAARVLYVTDDDEDKIFRYLPGRDRSIGTADDKAKRIFDTHRVGSRDPEGLAYQASDRSLWISDGTGSRVLHVKRGPDGRFNTADDLVTRFGTLSLGLRDPEGIEYDPGTGHLFLVSSNDKIIAETTPGGALVRTYDLSFAGVVSPSAITLAPGSADPSQTHIFVTDRGVDNGVHLHENDGRLFEFAIS